MSFAQGAQVKSNQLAPTTSQRITKCAEAEVGCGALRRRNEHDLRHAALGLVLLDEAGKQADLTRDSLDRGLLLLQCPCGTPTLHAEPALVRTVGLIRRIVRQSHKLHIAKFRERSDLNSTGAEHVSDIMQVVRKYAHLAARAPRRPG